GGALGRVELAHGFGIVPATGGGGRRLGQSEGALFGIVARSVHLGGAGEPDERLAGRLVVRVVAERGPILFDRRRLLALPLQDRRAVVVGLDVERLELDGDVQVPRGLVVPPERAQGPRQARLQPRVTGVLGRELAVEGNRLLEAARLEVQGRDVAIAGGGARLRRAAGHG